jgi:hypothetical protein
MKVKFICCACDISKEEAARLGIEHRSTPCKYTITIPPSNPELANTIQAPDTCYQKARPNWQRVKG